METLVLTDKSIFPTDDLLFSIIGRNRVYWEMLLSGVHQKYPDAEELWKYYADGKSWLFRMVRKKKTLFWVGVLKGTFRVTFYFGAKAEPLILNSGLPEKIVEDFKTGKTYGKIRGISIKVQSPEDIENCLKLADIRNRI
jgi:hypothetical protein